MHGMNTPDQPPIVPAHQYPQYAPILPPKKHTTRNVLLIIVAGLVALCGVGTIIAATTSSGQAGSHAAATQPSSTAEHLKPGQVDPAAASPNVVIIPVSPAAKPTTPAAPPPPAVTTAQQQAVGAAQDYLGIMHFSRSGLIGQLEHDGFNAADASYGADHAGADWMAQAAGAAQDYLKLMHFSRSGLIGQLEHDGFTKAEAEHGVSAAGL